MSFLRRLVGRIFGRKKAKRKNDASIYPMF